MILRWKKENVNYIELVLSEDDRKKGLKPPKRNHLTLLPGVNEIDDAEFELIKSHMQPHLDSKILEVVDQTSSLHLLNATEAKAFLKNTVSADTLNRWLAKEERADIRNRIRDRLKELNLEEAEVEIPEEAAPKKGKKGKEEAE